VGNYVTAYALLKDFLADVGFNAVFREVPSNLSQAVPLVTVVRFGGVDGPVTIDRPRVQIDVFASSADSAEDLAEDLRTAMRTRLPKRMFGGAVVGRVETMSGPQLLPWSTSGVFRVGARYQLTVHQYTGIS
jgi:hypothetical protein